MSMNVKASFKGVPLDIGLLQTPTEITYKIIESENPLEEYFKYAEKIFNNCHLFLQHKQNVSEYIKELGKDEVEWHFE